MAEELRTEGEERVILSQAEVEERAETITYRIQQTRASRGRYAVEFSVVAIVKSHGLLLAELENVRHDLAETQLSLDLAEFQPSSFQEDA